MLYKKSPPNPLSWTKGVIPEGEWRKKGREEKKGREGGRGQGVKG